MKRISTVDAAPSRPANDDAGSEGFFTEGNPGGGVAATQVSDDWLNSVQEMLIGAVEAAGLTPSDDDTQLTQAINILAQAIQSQSAQGLLMGRLVRESATRVRLDRPYSGRIVVEIGGQVLDKNDASLIFDITTDLFEGTEEASTWYYLYLEDSGGVVVTHMSATPPDLGTMYHGTQTGYRCIGAVFNDASSNFMEFDHAEAYGRSLVIPQLYRELPAAFAFQPGTTSGAAYASIDLSGFVPLIAREVLISASWQGDGPIFHYGPESFIGTTKRSSRQLQAQNAVANSAIRTTERFWIPLDAPGSPQIGWWREVLGGQNNHVTDHNILVVGWR